MIPGCSRFLRRLVARSATAHVGVTTSKKDLWDLADLIVKGLLPLAVVFATFYTSRTLAQVQDREANVRLYTELMTKREDSDTTLRRGMFESVLKSFLEERELGPERHVLNLELLAENFHESLDLKPLFKHVNRQLAKTSGDEDLRRRLRALAKHINDTEISTLSQAGASFEWGIDFERLSASKSSQPTFSAVSVTLKRPIDNITLKKLTPSEMATVRYIRLEALDVDFKQEQVRIRIAVTAPGKGPDEGLSEIDDDPWIGLYDFPMVENIRLSNGERCAAVLTNFNELGAEVRILLFPGSRASLKDKLYYDEIVNDLGSSEAYPR